MDLKSNAGIPLNKGLCYWFDSEFEPLLKFFTFALQYFLTASSEEKKMQLIPVRLGITHDELLDFSPLLAGSLALELARDTDDVSALVEKLIMIARPKPFNDFLEH